MIRFPEAIVDVEALRFYELEWIVRGHPAPLLPLHCTCREGKAHLKWMTEGLQPCAEAVRIAADTEEDPFTWLIRLLTEIRGIAKQSEEALLDSTRFLLRSDALWFYPASGVRGTDGASTEVPVLHSTPLLTYLPAIGTQTEGSLAALAEELAEMFIADGGDKISDPHFLALRDAAVAGCEAFETYLEEVSKPPSSQGPGEAKQEDIQAGTTSHIGRDSSDGPGHSSLLRSLRITGWLVGPALVACFPAVMRLFLPDHMDRESWRMLSAGCLGLTAIADALLLFLPTSPLRLLGTDAESAVPSHPHEGPWRAIGRFRRDVRVSGLLSACAARMGKIGRMGAHTAPSETLDPSERLGFLSEGEPGTPEETKGLRAYILTTDFIIGRDPDFADLVLPDAEVGRSHARITQYNGSFFLTDLGSVNGTRLNGRRLDKHVEVPLPDRCRIGIAGRQFHFIVD